MRFKPVYLPADRELGRKANQTLLRHYSRCPRAGYLARRFDSAPTAEMARGSALHEIQERAVKMMLDAGEVTAPGELVRAVADEVLAEMHVPVEEHDFIREMAWRWASETAIDPGAVVAVETLFVLDVDVDCPECDGLGWDPPYGDVRCERCDGLGRESWEVRCRIDFAELADDGRAVVVQDIKSSKAAVGWEDMSRKRGDGSLVAKDFQLILYALALAFGVPVREDECPTCGGKGCDACNRGRVETREPFPVAAQAQRFDLSFVYPAIEDREGRMVRRGVDLTRLELDAYRVSLEGLVGRLARSEVEGDWPALVSDAACGECPASALCPIPAELRDHRGTINTPEQLAEALEVMAREKKVAAAKSKEIRAAVKVMGPVRFGGGMVAEIGHSRSVRIPDKDALFSAVDRAVEFGEPYDRAEFLKVVESFPLVVRALTPDELGAEDDR